MLQFANPALLFGALLLAVPLIIHLLNRRRHKKRPWAAMEFLLRAYQKQRKRLRRENLLLLLLRCAIPVFLAFALARPTLRDSSALGGLNNTSAHHVFVFDGSYSMGLDLPNGTTPFERARQLATAMIDGLGSQSGQKATMVVNGLRPQMPLREDLNLSRAKERIAALGNPTDAGAELTPALLQVADLIEESTDGTIHVYVFTDLQSRAFGDDPFRQDGDQPAAPAVTTPEEPTQKMFEDSAVDAIARIQERASLTMLDVRSGGGGDVHDNLQVIGLELGLPHAIAKTAVPIRAMLRNRSGLTRTVQATLEIDGEQPLRSSAEIEAGAEAEVSFDVTFRTTGQRRVRVSIDGDDLAADNARHTIVDVREQLRVLLVEGSDEEEPELRDATHMRRILDPTGGEGSPELTPFRLDTIDTVTFLGGRGRIEEYDVIVLANVPRVNETAAEELRTAVRGGAGVLVMLGDRVNVDSYNLHLHGSGDDLMPVYLTNPDEVRNTRGGRQHYGAEIVGDDHPVYADFAEKVFFQIFETLPIYRYVPAELPEPIDANPADGEPPPTRTRVLASMRTRNQTPLLVANEFGYGKALYLMSAISRRPDRWNELDYEVVSFPFLHQAAHWLALPAIDPFNVEVGTALTATTKSRPYDLAAVLPERAGLAKVPIGDDAQPLLGGRYALPPFGRTEHAGFYTIEMLVDRGGAQERDQLSFAVNPDPAEGELEFFSHEAAREFLGVERIVTDLPNASQAAIQSSFSDLGPLFLWLTLAALLGEAALARFVSRRRK